MPNAGGLGIQPREKIVAAPVQTRTIGRGSPTDAAPHQRGDVAPDASPSRMTVTVCIPVFNSVDTIGRSIESVLAQTHADFDCLVLDDHSTDGTAEVAASYADDPRVTVIRNERNLGMVGNHNRALDLARGDLVQFVGGDDWLLPTCLERLLPVFASPSVGLAFARRRVVTTNAGWSDRYAVLDGPLQPLEPTNRGHDLVRRYLDAGGNGNPIGEPTAVMLRRETVLRAGGFPAEVPQLSDIDTWMRVLCRSQAAFVEEELSVRWHHEGSATDQFSGTTNLDKLWLLSSLVRADDLDPALRRRALRMWFRTAAAIPKLVAATPPGRRRTRIRSFGANLRHLTTGRRVS
ncbi:hypothetical protein BEL07_16755 [Mycolicibacterium grossiae]|uniref:Glycosyltransferase 2-like domain-containing protein n=1 Tax=Mycolicibacterium grossiae TaxID=1552759 RepID=A0A1E8Q2K8_9MYCO|nr:hypothetical protein BEL07_16755 [Mycolicibacterium grossiae]